jgi:hypothetical protein
MSPIIHLGTARKRALRQRAQQHAGQNRLKHGRSKTMRALEEAKAAKADRLLEAHRLNRGDDQ